MKTKTLVLRHWEDVVFENRNKEYGAYALRRKYSDRVILGWGITIAIFATLFYAPGLLHSDSGALPKPFDPDKGELQFLPPPVLPVKPRPPQQHPPRQTATSTQVVVTTEPIETSTEPIEASFASLNDTGEGGAVEGYVDGTSVLPVEQPVVVKPPSVVDIAEVMPAYVGGYEAMMKFIKKKIRVPASFKYLGEGGTVYVRFIIDPLGNVNHVEVLRGISKDCDKEAARVISIMPSWIAGMQNGSAVPVRMVLPIRFAKE